MIKEWTKKYTRMELLFLALWTFYSVFYFLFNVSELYYTYEVKPLYEWARDVTMVLQVILLFYLNKESFRRIALCVLVLLLTFLVEYNIGSRNLQIYVLFMLLATQLNFDKILRFDFKLKTVLFIVIVGLCLFGVIPNYTDTINGTFKQAIGFTHPNTMTCYVMTLETEWLCIRYRKMRWFEWPLLLLVWAVVMQIGGGRSSGYTFMAIFVLFALANAVPKIFYSKFSKVCFALSAAVMTALCFITAWLYQRGNSLAVTLNSVMTGRLGLSVKFLEDYGVSLFGQKIHSVGARQYELTGEPYMFLDSSYLRCAINWGMVFLVLILVLYALWFLRCLKKGRVELALLGLFFVVMGFAEQFTFNVSYNLTFLFLLGGLGEGKTALPQNAPKAKERQFRAAIPQGGGWLTAAKGLAVVLLVWLTAGGIFGKYIPRMLYPFLFLIFGLLYAKGESLKQSALKILKDIYIPFAFWNILFYTVRALIRGAGAQKILLKDLRIALTIDKYSALFSQSWILGGLVLIPLVYKLTDTALRSFRCKEYVLLAFYGLIAVIGFQFTLPHKMSRILILGFCYALGAFVRKNSQKLRALFYPENAIFATVLFVLIAYHHPADMGTNSYANPALFLLGALAASYALLFYLGAFDSLKQKAARLAKKGLTYIGSRWADILLWQALAYKLVILLQLALNHEEISWEKLLSYTTIYSSSGAWWLIYLAAGIALPILSCNVLRYGPWGKFFRKTHLVSGER